MTVSSQVVQLELELILEDLSRAVQKADFILESPKDSTVLRSTSLDTTLLDIISELYLMKTQITLLAGSMI